MRRLTLIGALAAALVPAAAAITAPLTTARSNSVSRPVDIPGKLFSPDRLTVLIGDTVAWTNHDSSTHTVTSDQFDSGHLSPGSSFAVTFSQPGVYRYHCTIHRYMQGEIDVYAVALSGPAHSVPVGMAVTLTGLAGNVPAVTLEQQRADGSYTQIAAASVGSDGAFTIPVTATAPATYRVQAGTDFSAPVHVAPQPTVEIALRRSGAGTAITVSAGPGQGGAQVALERYLPERYWWRPLQHATLGGDGRVTFVVPGGHGLRYRAHLVQGIAGWGEAISAVVRER